jgi:hypothetical protein
MSDDQHTIGGLLRKRQELLDENGVLRERMAVIANDIEAIDRVLDAFGYQGSLEGRTSRAARIVLFYRNELRQFLQAELAKAGRPLSTRDLAIILCETEGKSPQGPAFALGRGAAGVQVPSRHAAYRSCSVDSEARRVPMGACRNGREVASAGDLKMWAKHTA